LYIKHNMNSSGAIRLLENASMFFQGGIRRNLFYFIGACILLAWPFYYVGLYTAKAVRYTWIDDKIVIYKPLSGSLAELQVGDSQVIDLANGQKDLYLTIDNKQNPKIGFFPYIYQLQILDDQGSVISSEKLTSYILPRDIKYITARDTTGNAESLKLTQLDGTQAVEYNVEKNPFQILPKVDTVNQNIQEIDSENLRVAAQFINRDKLIVDEVDITYILRDRRERIIGIGTAKFYGLNPENTREFTTDQPKHLKSEATSLDVQWSTNYLKEGNIKFK
jgi:hypothetical protein